MGMDARPAGQARSARIKTTRRITQRVQTRITKGAGFVHLARGVQAVGCMACNSWLATKLALSCKIS